MPNDTQSTHSLKQLLADWQTAVAATSLPQPPAYTGPDVRLSHLTENSQEVQPGACFVARIRETSDGHPYIGQAIERGAALILAQRPQSELDCAIPAHVVYLQVDNTAAALAWLAAAWEGFPSRQLVMIGVTGTDGKTTTSNILHHLLKTAGYKTGLLSTLKAVIGEREEPLALHVTTPEAPVVQHTLRRMVDAGVTHCILESTSHGLAQHRVDAVDFDVAIVTNITHEHLDYHGSYAAYFAAKARLFTALNEDEWRLPTTNPHKTKLLKTAVLNQDDASYQTLAQLAAPRQISYGLSSAADVNAANIAYAADKTWFDVHFAEPLGLVNGRSQPAKMNFTIPCATHLFGEFNLYNILAAISAARLFLVPPETIQHSLDTLYEVSGRMERITGGQEFLTLVDFAHTPNSLEKAITAARKMVAAHRGRVITVFGSAGKRDVEKRRLMAERSARAADITILTAEDPRTESLDDILEMMAYGCQSQGGMEGSTFWRVPDRSQAIFLALNLAQKEDIVLICGKGHEQSMCFGATEYPWDDRIAARQALHALLTGSPLPDNGLPTFRR